MKFYGWFNKQTFLLLWIFMISFIQWILLRGNDEWNSKQFFSCSETFIFTQISCFCSKRQSHSSICRNNQWTCYWNINGNVYVHRQWINDLMLWSKLMTKINIIWIWLKKIQTNKIWLIHLYFKCFIEFALIKFTLFIANSLALVSGFV